MLLHLKLKKKRRSGRKGLEGHTLVGNGQASMLFRFCLVFTPSSFSATSDDPLWQRKNFLPSMKKKLAGWQLGLVEGKWLP